VSADEEPKLKIKSRKKDENLLQTLEASHHAVN